MKELSEIKKEYYDLLRIVKDLIQYYQYIGLTKLPYPTPKFDSIPSFFSMEELNQYVINCRLCPIRRDQCSPVTSEGSRQAKLVFVGQSPGQLESREGKPFLGEAGELLARILSAIQLSRDQVYLSYAIKCPYHPQDILAPKVKNVCQGLLRQELKFLSSPGLICTLGQEATHLVLGKESPFEDLRGKIFTITVADHQVKVIPTYSLDYLLQNPEARKPAWVDMKLIRSEYDQL